MSNARDSYWTNDLLWYYLYQSSAKPYVGRETMYWFDQWYKKIDRSGALNDSREVYKLLVGNTRHTHPASDSVRGDSAIPWNQNNKEFLKNYRSMGGSKLPCGTMVKVFFQKYMKWVTRNVVSLLITGTGRCDPITVERACGNIEKNLQRHIPVRAGLGSGLSKSVSHYVGIVGCKGNREFLCIEPWDRNSVITYATRQTRFLAKLKYHSASGELRYTTGTAYRVLTVEV
jgi:hypothetical protein